MFPSPSLCTFVFTLQTMSSSIHISTLTVHSHIHCSLKRNGWIFFTNGFKLIFLEIVLIVFLERGLAFLFILGEGRGDQKLGTLFKDNTSWLFKTNNLTGRLLLWTGVGRKSRLLPCYDIFIFCITVNSIDKNKRILAKWQILVRN